MRQSSARAGGVTTITDRAELVRVVDDDPLIVWAGQRLPADGTRAWRLDDAVAVAALALCRRNRLAIRGSGERRA